MNAIESISYEAAATFLQKHNNYYILCHANPDGDAIGSGYGLCRVLRQMGKNANVFCSDPIPEKFNFITSWYTQEKFSPQNILSVDLADTVLLGKELSVYAEYVELAIDHHVSNKGYAKRTLINPEASSACEVIYELCSSQGLKLDDMSAMCLYTGILTDTGCFKFSSAKKRTHMVVAELMDYDIPCAEIAHQLFNIKTKTRIIAEQYAYNHLDIRLKEKCSMLFITLDIIDELKLTPEDLDGLTDIAMQLKGVEIGVVAKEKEKGKFKISLRSTANSDVDVSEICAKFGGGGHKRAAGCTVDGTIDQVKLNLLSAIAPALGIDLWTA